MNPNCLEHCLSESEYSHFEEFGYLMIENAISADRLKRLSQVCDRMLALKRSDGLGQCTSFDEVDLIGKDPVFVEMIDCQTTFPKVWGVLGWNIYLYHTGLIVNPPSDPNPAPGIPSVAWHQDSMRVNDEIESSPRPRLSLKAVYLISDVSEPGRANTWIVPGSHLKDEIEIPEDGQSNPPGAIPICGTPGTAFLLDRRLWHSRSRNQSEFTRKVLLMGYSYRWLRPKDEMTVEHLYPMLDPIQRQILGECPSNDSRYAPAEDDVPLRSWLREHRPKDAGWTPRRSRQSYRPDIPTRSS